MNKNKPYVLITGVAGGIGNSLVTSFLDEGYSIIATDIVKPNNLVGIDHFFQIDLESMVNNINEATTFYDDIKEIIGSNGLKALINNAATQIIKDQSELTVQDIILSFTVNCAAPFLLVKIFLEDLDKAKGSVVNISSIHANLTKPKFVAYATSKSALSGLTKALSIELGSRIRINAIAPAAILTPMLLAGFEDNKDGLSRLSSYHPVEKIGQPIDIAKLAVFLASENASFINGSIIKIDGGISNRLFDPE